MSPAICAADAPAARAVRTVRSAPSRCRTRTQSHSHRPASRSAARHRPRHAPAAAEPPHRSRSPPAGYPGIVRDKARRSASHQGGYQSGQHGETGAPAVPVSCAEEHPLADQAPRVDSVADQAEHRFGDDEPDVVLHPFTEAISPVCFSIGIAGAAGHPHFAVAYLDLRRGYVIGPQVECPARDEIKAGMVPVTGENTVREGAPMKRETQMRTAIVKAKIRSSCQITGSGSARPWRRSSASPAALRGWRRVRSDRQGRSSRNDQEPP